MNTLTLKNVPGEIGRRLKRSARLHHRSVNREAIALLEEKLSPLPPYDPRRFLAEVRALRDKIKGPGLSPEEFDAAVNAGRP
jgi:plasmid stability protein